MTTIAFHPATLLAYYAARLPLGAAAAAPGAAGSLPPWDVRNPAPPKFTDTTARASAPYFDPLDGNITSDTGSATAGAGSLIEAFMEKRLSKSSGSATLDKDNQKLFALYQAIYRLDHIASMANREDTIAGQLPGLNTSFQQGLSEVIGFVEGASFHTLTLMAGKKTASAESEATVPLPSYDYTGRDIVKQKSVHQPVPGVTTADRFTVAVTKGGSTTSILMRMDSVTGALTLDNINKYVNTRLASSGFTTTFKRVQTGGSVAEDTATYGIRVENGANETITLSSTQATQALYVAGSGGAAANQQGKLIKLDDLGGTPDVVYSTNIAPDDDGGTAGAKAMASDSNGNLYVVGSTSGSFGSQRNQATQDVFLTKHDAAGKQQWTRLLGSADTATAYALEIDPAGGVVIAGSVAGKLTPTSTGGSSDSFVAKYDTQGNQKWLRHTAPVASDQATALLLDSTGNVYVGGQLSGKISSSHTSAGGIDAYVTKLSNSGALLYHRQFGTSGADSVAAMGFGTDGRLIVASVQNGHALLDKFNPANGTSAALYHFDLGDLEGGSLTDLVIDDAQIYISGTTKNTALTAGGAANVRVAHHGSTDAFVFNLRDRTGAGGTQTPVPDYITYVGTTQSETAGSLTFDSGKVYLSGTTTGTFAGQTRSVQGTHNMFAARVDDDGDIDWTRQYGGIDAQSKGLTIAVDATGSSPLDTLGLPRGKLENNQSGTVEAQTTARAGDYFSMKITGPNGTREAKVTVGTGDTLRSLAIKINAHLFGAGKASTVSKVGGQALKIEANAGVQIQLVGGPKDFNALAGLGLSERTLINDAAASTMAKDLEADSESSVFGLGIDEKLDLLTKANASHAHSALQAALSMLKQAYATLNPSGAASSISGPGTAYAQARLANYQIALSFMV